MIANGRQKRPGVRMATARTVAELRRWADLTVIFGACEARMPGLAHETIGLREVAELCKRDYAARPARDTNHVRDQLLLIGVGCDLDRDRLDQQSEACLRCVADFLR
jgi:hypothetical protein